MQWSHLDKDKTYIMFKKIITGRSTVAKKLLFWFLLIALLPLGIAGYLNYKNAINILKKEVTNNLVAIADSNWTRIKKYISDDIRNSIIPLW